MRIEPLTKDNYDTWRMHAEAVLIKSDGWPYVDGSTVKPEPDQAAAQIQAWELADRKARSDLILAISPSELKQVKNCNTSREVWLKLETIYQSKGPARKANLLKRLTLTKMKEGEDVHHHLNQFFDAVDKLRDMDLEVNDDLLAILLLYSLPTSFENFRCAIESRDELPHPDALKVKILEEHDARKSKPTENEDAMYVKKGPTPNKSGKFEKSNKFKFKCHRCQKVGHKAAECRAALPEAMAVKETTECALHSVKPSLPSTKRWCLDSGATSHMSPVKEGFQLFQESSNTLAMANNQVASITGVGDFRILADNDKGGKPVILKKTLHVPDLRTNLMSVSKITDKGNEVIFRKEVAYVVNESREVLAVAKRHGDLYFVEQMAEEAGMASHQSKSSLMEWHERLGHLNEASLKKMATDQTVLGMKLKKSDRLETCETCIQGKQTQTPFPKNRPSRSSQQLEIVHMDLCGPMRVTSKGGARYFATFIDDYSRWGEITFLKEKSDLVAAFKEYRARAENFTGKKIKFVQNDNGREYVNNEMDEYLAKHGIRKRLTVPHTPQQNGIAERRNRTLVETARCMMLQSKLPPSFWAEAVSTANYLRNRCSSRSIGGETPFKLWTGKRPTVSHCKTFGSVAFALNKDPKKGKFDPRSRECTFLGYSEESKAYRLWSITEGKIITSRDVKFLDTFRPVTEDAEEFIPDGWSAVTPEEPSQRPIEIEPESTPIPVEIEEEPETAAAPLVVRGPGRPKLIKTGKPGRPKKQPNLVVVGPANEDDIPGQAANLADVQEPSTLDEALTGPNAAEWRSAVRAEYLAHMSNGTWDVVEKLADRKPIGARFVLKTKLNREGNVDRRKARLVAKGFTQRPGTDFHDTFAPVTRASSIRLMMALSAENGLTVHQMDVVTAFLNGEVEEELFLELPEEFESTLQEIIADREVDKKIKAKAEKWANQLRDGKPKVCRIEKAIYGLRQSGRQWYKKLDAKLREIGLKPLQADPCVYVKGAGEKMTIVAVYVDDILIATKDHQGMAKLKEDLSKAFKMKDMGAIHYCLGIEFQQNVEDGSITMVQKKYAEEVLTRFGMQDCKPVSTPLNGNEKLKKSTSEGAEKPNVPYQSLVGSLMYLAVSTRPDLAYTVSTLSQFNEGYDQSHWCAAKRALRYLKGTTDYGLVFKRTGEKLCGYIDADWAGCLEDRRSYTGYAFVMANAAISWEARKQRTVALSSTEAEYMAVSDGTKEAIYLQNYLEEIGTKPSAVPIYNDNQGALELVKNPVHHARTKHIDARHHFVREAYGQKRIEPKYMRTEEMAADVLTKALFGPKHQQCITSLGMSKINSL